MSLTVTSPSSIATISTILFTSTAITSEPEADGGSGRTVLADWIVGIAMMAASLACGVAYFVILVTIFKDKELFHMASYRFMFFLGVFDITQCFPHFVTGIFTIKQTVFHPWLAKAMGIMATPCYVAYAVLTIFLSFNRLIQLSSPTLDRYFFGDNRWTIWIGLAFLSCVCFMLALGSPWATIRYIPDWYSWEYDYSLPGSYYVQKVEMVIEVGGIFVSAFFYCLIVHRLLKTKKRFMVSKSYNAEVKVLIQASVITVYCTVLNVLWHNYSWMLPLNLVSYTALNFMWILNSGVYPVIYFIVNKALRDRIVVKKSRTTTGAVSVLQNKSRTERTGTNTGASMVAVA